MATPTHASPSERDDLPVGRDGGPATIDNPVPDHRSSRPQEAEEVEAVTTESTTTKSTTKSKK